MRKYIFIVTSLLFLSSYSQSRKNIYFLIDRNDTLIKKQIATQTNEYEGYRIIDETRIVKTSRRSFREKPKDKVLKKGEIWISEGDDVEYETSIKVEQIEECKYPVHKIVFLNRWGAFQDLYFFKKSSESLNTTSENFNRSIFEARKTTYGFPFGGGGCTAAYTYNVYNSNAHANKTFNSNGVESITLNSGYVNELMNPYFEELMVSEYVWLIGSNNVVYPVNLKESSFDKKTGLNNGLINYTMNFDKSFALVNNIR